MRSSDVGGRRVRADDARHDGNGSSDGYPGQDAGEATAGLDAAVILQTCYFDSDDVRLVALVPLA